MTFDFEDSGGAQTAFSDGWGPTPLDLDVSDLSKHLHMRRALMDAVDHAIALLDALDALNLDLEAVDEDGDPLEISGEGDPLEDAEDDGTAEPTLGAPENHPFRFHFDMDDGYHRSRRRAHLGDQTNWARGRSEDGEGEGDKRSGRLGQTGFPGF